MLRTVSNFSEQRSDNCKICLEEFSLQTQHISHENLGKNKIDHVLFCSLNCLKLYVDRTPPDNLKCFLCSKQITHLDSTPISFFRATNFLNEIGNNSSSIKDIDTYLDIHLDNILLLEKVIFVAYEYGRKDILSLITTKNHERNPDTLELCQMFLFLSEIRNNRAYLQHFWKTASHLALKNYLASASYFGTIKLAKDILNNVPLNIRDELRQTAFFNCVEGNQIEFLEQMFGDLKNSLSEEDVKKCYEIAIRNKDINILHKLFTLTKPQLNFFQTERFRLSIQTLQKIAVFAQENGHENIAATFRKHAVIHTEKTNTLCKDILLYVLILAMGVGFLISFKPSYPT